MTTTNVQYSGAAVPLGGMGQWAGTYGAGPGQKSPLNAIRNGTGRYNTYADYQSGQNSQGQKRPMAPFRTNLACVQGQSPGYSTTLSTGVANFTFQGQFTGGATVNAPGAVNIFTSPTTQIRGTAGYGGAGRTYFDSPSTGNGGTALNVTQSGVNILNYGTIYGGGGGGGGGGFAFASAGVQTPGGAVYVFAGGGGGGGIPGGAGGQSTAQGYIQSGGVGGAPGQAGGPQTGGGAGNYSITNSGPYGNWALYAYGGNGGNAGADAQAGSTGGGGSIDPATYPAFNQNAFPGMPGGFAGAAVTGPSVTYVVQGTHN